MLDTTFSLAKEAGACAGSYKKFAKHVGGITKYGKDTPIPLTDILDVLGMDDALWALRCVIPTEAKERDRIARTFACDCAESVLQIYETEYPGDSRCREAINTARRFIGGNATEEELDAAWAAAGDAAWAAAGDAARAAAWAAAWAAAGVAAGDAAGDAARAAAWAAARDAAWAAASDWQKQRLLKYLLEEGN